MFNGLIWFYRALPWNDLGVAIILLTTLIRLILAPLLWKAQNAQRKLQLIQPELQRIQKENKSDKEAQSKALMELYAKHGVNPFSGCLMMLIQFPILIALLGVFQSGFDPNSLSYLYSFVTHPGTINHISFGFLDLSKGSWYIGLIAAATQFIQTKMASVKNPQADKTSLTYMMQMQSIYMFPAIIFITSLRFPSALGLYWTVMNVFGILQEIVMRKRGK